MELGVDDTIRALRSAGLEIYQATEAELLVAERVRLHLMDSGVRICLGDGSVEFTARAQESDHAQAPRETLLHRVREMIGSQAGQRGYREQRAKTVRIQHPSDSHATLDTWHEIAYRKEIASPQDAVDEVRWALGFSRCV